MEFVFEPYQKITIRSYLEYGSPEDFVTALTISTPEGVPAQGGLNWANGILFRFYPLAPSESISREYVGGHLLWDHVEFALMPKYVKEVKVPSRPLITFGILDVSNHVLLGPFAEWVARTLAKRDSKRKNDS